MVSLKTLMKDVQIKIKLVISFHFPKMLIQSYFLHWNDVNIFLNKHKKYTNQLDFDLVRKGLNEFTLFQFGKSCTPTDQTTDDYKNEEGLVCPLAAHRHKN